MVLRGCQNMVNVQTILTIVDSPTDCGRRRTDLSTLVNELSIGLVWYLRARFVRSGGKHAVDLFGLRPFC